MSNNLLSAISLIRSDNFILTNRDLVHAIGLEEAVILADLSSKYAYYAKEEKLDEDGSFYCTVDTLEAMTSIKEKLQRKALNHLQELGILKVILKGMKAKRYILFSGNLLEVIVTLINKGAKNQEELKQRLAEKAKLKAEATERVRQEKSQFRQNDGTGSAEMEELVPSKRRTINNNSISNKISSNKSLIEGTTPNKDNIITEKDTAVTVIKGTTLLIPDNNSSNVTQPSPNAKKSSIDYVNPDFNTFWENYPQKVDKAKAFKAYQIAIVTSGYTAEQINTACTNYAKECLILKKAEQYIKYPASFLEKEYFPKYVIVTQTTVNVGSTTKVKEGSDSSSKSKQNPSNGWSKW